MRVSIVFEGKKKQVKRSKEKPLVLTAIIPTTETPDTGTSTPGLCKQIIMAHLALYLKLRLDRSQVGPLKTRGERRRRLSGSREGGLV